MIRQDMQLHQKDAGKEGSTGYRAVTNVFGDDKTGYATSPERCWKRR